MIQDFVHFPLVRWWEYVRAVVLIASGFGPVIYRDMPGQVIREIYRAAPVSYKN